MLRHFVVSNSESGDVVELVEKEKEKEILDQTLHLLGSDPGRGGFGRCLSSTGARPCAPGGIRPCSRADLDSTSRIRL
jgi:hypothetical protein